MDTLIITSSLVGLILVIALGLVLVSDSTKALKPQLIELLKTVGLYIVGFVILVLLIVVGNILYIYVDWATVLTILYVMFLAWVGYMSLVIVYNLIVAVGSDTAKPNFYDGFIIALLLVLIIR